MSTELFCAFCSKSQSQVRSLVAGPDVHICNGCVTSAIQEMLQLSDGNSVSVAGYESRKFLCSFCGKSQLEAKCLAAGPAVFICEECLGTCFTVLVSNGPAARVVRVNADA
jgi:ATP-dependent protease Clp ATPase subunit